VKRVARRVKALDTVAEPVKAAPKKRANKAVVEAEAAVAQQPPASKKSTSKAGAIGAKASVPVNDPMGFLTFVSAHPVDAVVEGTVASFTSHGAMVAVELDGGLTVLCYAPTKHLSTPPPKSAREVLVQGTTYSFMVRTLDAARRVAEVSFA